MHFTIAMDVCWVQLESQVALAVCTQGLPADRRRDVHDDFFPNLFLMLSGMMMRVTTVDNASRSTDTMTVRTCMAC